MSDSVHSQLVAKIAEWGAPISYISHAGMGDPLTDRGLEMKIGHEKQIFKDAQVVIYTNAGLLDQKRAEALLSSGVDVISVSLNGFRKETYETVMNISYERTLSNVLTLLKLIEDERSGVKVHVSLIPTELHSPDEIKKFEDFWRDRVEAVVVPTLISWGTFLAHSSREHQWPCRYIWEVFQIDWDGAVAMCCEDYESQYPTGNLLKQQPDDIYNSSRMQRQRMNQVKGNFGWPPMCRDCVETHAVARSFWDTAELTPCARHSTYVAGVQKSEASPNSERQIGGN